MADRTWFDGLIQSLVPKHLGLKWDDVVKCDVSRLVYGDFMVPGADPKIYTEISDTAKMASCPL